MLQLIMPTGIVCLGFALAWARLKIIFLGVAHAFNGLNEYFFAFIAASRILSHQGVNDI